MNEVKQYMVEFDILYPLEEELVALIPDQRTAVNDLFTDGVLHSYTLNIDRTKLWAVFQLENESNLIRIIDSLPMTRYMDYTYHELTFHNSLNMIPAISLN